MSQTLTIRWRLKEVMARHDIKAGDLAAIMEVSANAIANLRRFEMPRMTEERLNQLLNALNTLKARDKQHLITPNDLIDYVFDPPEGDGGEAA